MKVPFSWLKQYVDIDVSAQELETKLFDCGFEVEELIDLGAEISKVVVGVVTECVPQEGTHLHICKVDCGDYGHDIQISTGASNDLQQATNIARQMITKYGFSERLGPVVYGTSQEETFLGRDFGQGKGYSETTAAEIDSEMRDIIDEAYETCRRTLTEHIDQLHALAQALMEREKLNEQEFNTVMAGGKLPPRDGDEPVQEPAAPAAPVETAEPAESAEPAEQAEQAVLGEEMPDPAQDAPQENE